jgi:hypothetical protein
MAPHSALHAVEDLDAPQVSAAMRGDRPSADASLRSITKDEASAFVEAAAEPAAAA